MGDLVAMPMKTTSQIALGVVSEEYWYRENIEGSSRIGVEAVAIRG